MAPAAILLSGDWRPGYRFWFRTIYGIAVSVGVSVGVEVGEGVDVIVDVAVYVAVGGGVPCRMMRGASHRAWSLPLEALADTVK